MYIQPVNEIFKFSKVYEDMEWKAHNREHRLEVREEGKLISRVRGRTTSIPALIPYSKPRSAWLIRKIVTPYRCRESLADMTLRMWYDIEEGETIVNQNLVLRREHISQAAFS